MGRGEGCFENEWREREGRGENARLYKGEGTQHFFMVVGS